MFKISPLDWTDLNPTAPSFTPKNFCNKTKIAFKGKPTEENGIQIKTGGGVGSLVGVSSNTTASVSEANEKKISRTKAKNKFSPNKPSLLTLEQFISDKLKIENSIKKESNNRNNENRRKVRTDSIPHNLLDSSAPTRKRGKERETPKPKKPTTLKRIINNEKNSMNSNEESGDRTESLNICHQNLDLEELNNKLLHCKTYREYCSQRLTRNIDELVVNLLTDLVVFQDRLYARDPMKAQIKRRLCFGFKEVTNYAKLNKIKLLIIAPDIEKIESKGGLDDNLSALMAITRNNEIPIVFALNRQRLGITSKKRAFVSCVAVLNYDGSQENFKQITCFSEIERNEYKSIFDQSLDKLKNLSSEEINEILNNLPNIPNIFIEFRSALNPSDRRSVKLKKKTESNN